MQRFPSYFEGARPRRLELLTHGLEIRCSIRLSYGRNCGDNCRSAAGKIQRDAPEGYKVKALKR
jgi:hypothetical protein